jgi:glycosyltransferase involved in cell wall biosynthesis
MRDALPLVCICIPTFNAQATIVETLLSILNQTYTHLSVVVVDNASSDNTVTLVEEFADARVKIHRNPVNLGGEGNFTRCVELAHGKYTAIFHADDVYQPTMVELQVAFLEAHPQAGAVFTEARLINEAGDSIGVITAPAKLQSLTGEYDFPNIFRTVLKHANFLICPSAMVRTEVYQRDVKIWQGTEFGTSADLDVWFKILLRHPIGILRKPLINYRISTNQHSSGLRARITRSDMFRVLDHYLELPNVRVQLTASDWVNFARLERTDRVVRAVNLYLLGQEQEAQSLCREAVNLDAFWAGLVSKRGSITLTLSLFLRGVIFLKLSVLARPVLQLAKRLINK